MKLRFKRSLALLLCLALLGTLLPALPAQAEEIGIIPVEDPAEAEPVGDEEIVVIGEEPAEPMSGEPTIAEQPQSITKTIGYTAKFKVVASGATKYQWYYRTSASGSWHKSTLTGCTSATLSVVAKTSRDGYQYRCKVSNSSGCVYSSAATLTVTAKPVITTQPNDVSVIADSTAKFAVKASGATGYQWYWRSSSSGSWAKSTLSGSTTATLSVKATAARDGYQYRCKVSNAGGAVYSSAATLKLLQKPTVTTQPKDKAAAEGETAVFTVKATDAAAYQWYWRSGSSGSWAKSTLPGNTTPNLSVTAKSSRSGYQYRCKVSNDLGAVYSKAATLTVLVKPAITTQPKSVTAYIDSSVQFTVKATDATAYQWYWRSSSSGSWAKSTLSGSRTATLSVTATDARNGYQYRCKVSNAAGYVYSNTATLTVSWTPVITSQPQSTTVVGGGTVVFSVQATGADSYQWFWRKDDSVSWSTCPYHGADTATMTSSTITYNMDGYQFCCRVTNSNGSVWSDTATLGVLYGQPAITGEPADAAINEGETARFTVKATGGGLSYQWYWWKESAGAWVKCAGASAATATLTYTEVEYAWNGYLFCCEVSNSNGSVRSVPVMLTVVNRTMPVIKTQPAIASVNEGQTASFTVTARYADRYQWYWWKESEGVWVKCGGASAVTRTLTFTDVPSAWNGYRFYCAVTNSEGSVVSEPVKLIVSDIVKYRALLVGESDYPGTDSDLPATRHDVDNMAEMLASVKGPKGSSYLVTRKYDLSQEEFESAVRSCFSSADSNDVSLLFLSSHGSRSGTGSLVLIGENGEEYLSFSELAECLKKVPGKIVVIIDACYSGKAIHEENGVGATETGPDPSFNEAVIRAFAEADPASNTGELRDSKFYVMTASAADEFSWCCEDYSYFSWHFCQGALGDKPADADGNGILSMKELFDYVYERAKGPYYRDYGNGYYETCYQHAQMYPEHSGYALFK